MGKPAVSLIVLVFLLSGCTFSYEVITSAPPVTDPATALPTPFATQIAASPVATLSATPTLVPVAPTLAPPTTDPIFFNGRSSGTADDRLTGTSTFPVGTKIVYVVWDYDNMRDGMLVRREWYLDGQPWLVREEAWDFAKYGSTGTMRDVSIHDDVNGLDSGVFHFRVYIDNVLQPIGGSFYEPIQEWVTFEISSSADLIPGDLGMGKVYGQVLNATGAPVAGAMVTCEHYSYVPRSLCAGTVSTNTDGSFTFNNVFFHDTDNITLTVRADDYETKELSHSSFTMVDWNATIVLVREP